MVVISAGRRKTLAAANSPEGAGDYGNNNETDD